AGGGAKIRSERRLPVRPRRHEVVRSAGQETGGETGHDVSAVIFERDGRHRYTGIGGGHGGQRGELPPPPPRDEPVDDPPPPTRERTWRRLPARRVSPVQEEALDLPSAAGGAAGRRARASGHC